MSDTIDLGLVTAYGNAKVGGYTGTESQFNDLMANLPTYTADALTYKNQAAASATAANDAADRAEAIVGGQFVSYGTAQGLTAAQQSQARDNITATPYNANLIDNSWFMLNSRQAAPYSGATQYTVDRWLANFGTTEGSVSWSGGSHYVTLSTPSAGTLTFYQRIYDKYIEWNGRQNPWTLSLNCTLLDTGATWTCRVRWMDSSDTQVGALSISSVVLGLNTVSDYAPTGTAYGVVQIYGGGGQIRFNKIKLEVGNKSTLSLDPPPNIEEEALRCMTSSANESDLFANYRYAPASNENLLDNGWFTINQRGATNVTDRWAFICDRWHIVNAGGTWNQNANSGLTFTINEGVSYSRIGQRNSDIPLRRATGRPLTLTANIGGTYVKRTATIPSVPTAGTTPSILDIYFNDNGVSAARCQIVWDVSNAQFVTYITLYRSFNLRAVKVEIGPQSTLALDTAPNMAEEQLKCQKYFVRIHPTTTNSPLGSGYALNATVTRILVPTPVWMQYVDTVIVSSIGNFRLYGNGQILTPTAASYNSMTRNGIVVTFTVSDATAAQTYTLTEASTGIYLGFESIDWETRRT